jgi:hypothetical protein
MKYKLISKWKKKAEVSRLCNLFDVSRSGFYASKLREKASVIFRQINVNTKEVTC